jgi:hypothetical protein
MIGLPGYNPYAHEMPYGRSDGDVQVKVLSRVLHPEHHHTLQDKSRTVVHEREKKKQRGHPALVGVFSALIHRWAYWPPRIDDRETGKRVELGI